MPSSEPPTGLHDGAEAASEKLETRGSRSAIALANRGWSALEAGQAEEAMRHFRTALRLQSDLAQARAGIVEALKARHPIYRWLLASFFWLARFPFSTQIALLVGAFLLTRLVSSLVTHSNDNQAYVWVSLVTFGLFALLGLASPIFNLLLRLDPLGSQALDNDQRRGTTLLLANLAIPFPLLLWSLYAQDGMSFAVWIMLTIIALPASFIYRCAPGWPRWMMAAACLGVTGIVLPLLGGIFWEMPAWIVEQRSNLIAAYVYALIGSMIASTALMFASLRR